jgi:signal transduction histidine kinase
MKIRFYSLRTRLTIALLLAVMLPTIFIGWLASDTMFENIRAERIADVGRIARSKHDQLVMVLTRANARTEHFLAALSVQCGGYSDRLNRQCATGLISSYLASEGAVGATLRIKGRDSLTIGASAVQNNEPVVFHPGQLAKFAETGPKSDHSYFVSVAKESAGLQLTITYSASQLASVFVPPPRDLGTSGETFLADGQGYFATPPRYPSTQGHSHPITARPMESCLSGQSREVLDLDYRDAAIIHGFRFIPELGSACIMAHVAQEEAFAPLKSLQRKIMIAILLFGTVLMITAVYLAKSIVKPIIRLTEVSRFIAAGDFKTKADVAGSDEISELAASFNFMTHQLRNFSTHLQHVREDEKANFAREIHDDLGGILTVLKMKTYWLKSKLSESADAAAASNDVDEISQLVDNATNVMRGIITGLRPTVLDDLGLLAALEWQAGQFHKHTGIECRVNCVCEKSEYCSTALDKQRSIALFRISQEALTNVARHSGATKVGIEFLRNDEEVVLSIIDNGRGMKENRTDASQSYGMLGMRERADQLGGKINVGTPPGGGFIVTVTLPLRAHGKEKT